MLTTYDVYGNQDLAYELREVDLELQDVFRFTLAPVDLKKPRIVTAFVEVNGWIHKVHVRT